MIKHFCLALFICVLLNVELIAQNGAEKPITQWWTQSSRIDKSKQFLYYGRGRFNFSKTSTL